jgi:uncharacterized membrane protein (DUF485 family)
MCKEMPVIPVNKVVDPKKNNWKKWKEERYKWSLTQKRTFGIFYDHVVHFVFVFTFLPVLVSFTKKNLATLVFSKATSRDMCGLVVAPVKVLSAPVSLDEKSSTPLIDCLLYPSKSSIVSLHT